MTSVARFIFLLERNIVHVQVISFCRVILVSFLDIEKKMTVTSYPDHAKQDGHSDLVTPIVQCGNL